MGSEDGDEPFDQGEDFDIEKILDGEDGTEFNWDKTTEPQEPDIPEWYSKFKEDLFDLTEMQRLANKYDREKGSAVHQKVTESVKNELQKLEGEATIDLTQDSELYRRTIDGNYIRKGKKSREYGFLLGKEIEDQRQNLQNETDKIRIELPSHYKRQWVEVDSSDQDEFWNTVIEYFAHECYKQNFTAFVNENSDHDARELAEYLTEITGDQTLMEADLEELIHSEESVGRDFIEFKRSQAIDPYHEPFVEGLGYAKVTEKQV